MFTESSHACPKGQPYLDPQGVPQTCVQLSATSSTCPYGFWCHVGAHPNDSACCEQTTDDPCSLTVEKGEGAHALKRWYFDQKRKMCLPFTYMGAKGNQNNFMSADACRLSCKSIANIQLPNHLNEITKKSAWNFTNVSRTYKSLYWSTGYHINGRDCLLFKDKPGKLPGEFLVPCGSKFGHYSLLCWRW